MEPIVNICLVGLAFCASVIGENNYAKLLEEVKSDGYEFETHEVLTDDGYILNVFRIPSKRVESRWPPVLIGHGLGGSAADFIMTSNGNSLAYLLSNEGFDVWLLNFRGTIFSGRHTILKSTDSEFWNYSWHEMGVYDLPNTIDYILKLTGFEKLLHIGLSQGTTTFYVMLSERPEYNDKILAHVSYAPSVFLCDTTSALLLTLSLPEFFGLFSETLVNVGYFNLAPYMPAVLDIAKTFCDCNGSICLICQHVFYISLDVQRFQNLNAINSIKHIKYDPAGASVKAFVHYAQGIHKCQFRHYQHSKLEISKEYDLSNINAPLFIFYGEKDNLQNPKDTMRFKSRLRNGFNETFMIKDFGHFDFITAFDAKERVYDKTIEILKRLSV